MAMSPTDIETILKFYLSKLPEDQLAELDEQLAGGVASVAQDASPAAQAKHDWLALDARSRNALRRSRGIARLDQAKARADFAKEFPHANRLG